MGFSPMAEENMNNIASTFPELIYQLARVNLGLEGAGARLLQGEKHQILFMKFSEDTEIKAHSHEAQWGVVLNGQIDLTIAGKPHTFKKGDSYFIPAGVVHSAIIYAGYADVTLFDSPNRYSADNYAT